jgi:ribonuclease P protein component
MAIATLKKRSEFQRVRGGGRWSGPAFLMEGRPRPNTTATTLGQGAIVAATRGRRGPDAPSGDLPRFGFTITRKLGGAVIRNRMRRRIKAALAAVAGTCADPRFDYVIVARPAALDRAFADIRSDLEFAFRRVHSGSDGRKDGMNEAKRPRSK